MMVKPKFGSSPNFQGLHYFLWTMWQTSSIFSKKVLLLKRQAVDQKNFKYISKKVLQEKDQAIEPSPQKKQVKQNPSL